MELKLIKSGRVQQAIRFGHLFRRCRVQPRQPRTFRRPGSFLPLFIRNPSKHRMKRPNPPLPPLRRQQHVLGSHWASSAMSTPPPRKRVSQACQPCGLKKIKVRPLHSRSPQQASQWLILVNSAMGRIQCAARARVRALNVHMEYQNEG